MLRAIAKDHVEAVKFFLEHGANTEARMEYGRTALISSAPGGEDNYVSLLLESGADVNAVDDHGRTALVWAIVHDSLPCVKLLLSHGANFRVKDRQGKNILLRAVKEQCTTSALFLHRHLRRLRIRKIRGILRFLIVARRYREDLYRKGSLRIDAGSFKKRRIQP